jgi:hypothetical protein
LDKISWLDVGSFMLQPFFMHVDPVHNATINVKAYPTLSEYEPRGRSAVQSSLIRCILFNARNLIGRVVASTASASRNFAASPVTPESRLSTDNSWDQARGEPKMTFGFLAFTM